MEGALTTQPGGTEGAAHARRASFFTLADLFRRSARLYAERPAIVCGDVELTYRDLDERSDRLACALRDRGLGRGDRVAALSTTRPEYAELYLAAAKLGVTVVALNIRLHADEIRHCLELSRPTLAVVSPGLIPLLESADGNLDAWRLPERPGGDDGEYARVLRTTTPERLPRVSDPEDIHCVLFTSGTTGRPKGAMISQRASVMRAFRCVDWFELTPDDGMIGWIPMFHTGGDECLQATLLSGGKFATFERADPAALFRGIERHRLTWTSMLPGLITDFLHHPDRAKHDLSSLRFTLGYANMMPRVVQEFTQATNSGFWDTFGQTESSFVVALDLVRPGEEPTLRKRPAPLLDVRIVDEQMRDVEFGIPGECVVRGPTVMSGYLEDPEATQDAFHGGWLHTGDVLVAHEDGTLTYVDRLKYLIKTGGENVYPAEVEEVIQSLRGVREAAVFGVPDAEYGQVLAAFVEGSAKPDAVKAACKKRLASFKVPRIVEIVDELPRTGTGKVRKKQLIEQVKGSA